MADLSVSCMGLNLRNPLIVASSGLTSTVDGLCRLEDGGVGAVVLKSLFEEQISNEANAEISAGTNEYSRPEAYEYIQSYVKNERLSDYLELIQQAKKKLSIPVIASINCVSNGEWVEFARDIEKAGADALELNVFIMPSSPKTTSSQIEEQYLEIIDSVRPNFSRPLSMKVGFYFTAMANVLQKLGASHLAGLALFNRFYRPDIDIEKISITAGGAYSSGDEISLPLRWIAMMSDEVDCDLIGTTGIHDSEGVIKMLLAGARGVEMASVFYQQGPQYAQVILKQLEDWMQRHDFAAVSDFVGKLGSGNMKDPQTWERVQYMKHFS
jgi:dihydroorotate dehydrogenase (fumarate)